MEAIAHSPSFAKKVGVPQSVGKDFSKADKGKTFKRGGDMATKGVNPFAKFEKSGKDTEKKGMKEGSKAEMAMDKKQMMGMNKGGMTKMAKGGGIESKGKTKGKMIKMMAMMAAKKRGAMAPAKPAAPAGGMMGMKKGGSVGTTSMGKVKTAAPSRDGVAVKGKTKGTMIKMNKGGKAC